MNRELLAEYGIDYDRGLKNCMGDPAFYKTLLGMFLKDECFPRARAAYAAGDIKELFSSMHELKGASGNAALTELYNAIVPLVELLRTGDAQKEDVDRLFAAADEAYRRTYEGVSIAVSR